MQYAGAIKLAIVTGALGLFLAFTMPMFEIQKAHGDDPEDDRAADEQGDEGVGLRRHRPMLARIGDQSRPRTLTDR